MFEMSLIQTVPGLPALLKATAIKSVTERAIPLLRVGYAFDYAEDLRQWIEDASEAFRERFRAELAFEIERVLRRTRGTLWPIDTGFSRDRFRAEDDAKHDVIILNTAKYAKAVNNRKYYPRGGSNPNYQAGQRTVRKHWRVIRARALRRATDLVGDVGTGQFAGAREQFDTGREFFNRGD